MSFPQYLYRFFNQKDHRDQFIQGLIRFGRLEAYKEIEDEQRKDKDEGDPRGKYKTDKQIYLKISNQTGKVVEHGIKLGDINISGYSPNNFFIVSATDEKVNVEKISEKFGKYVVKINNPQKLLDLLNKNRKFPWSVGKIVLERVKYDKDNYLEIEESNPHLPFGYYYAQKPQMFSDEMEWRFVLIGSGIDELEDKFVVIEIGSIENIITRIDL